MMRAPLSQVTYLPNQGQLWFSPSADRPSPPPKPGPGRPPGERPKVGPRVAAKPHPPLPKRPPVASKPTSPATNGTPPDRGSLAFKKIPPPLPSTPPRASPRETPPRPPVPAARCSVLQSPESPSRAEESTSHTEESPSLVKESPSQLEVGDTSVTPQQSPIKAENVDVLSTEQNELGGNKQTVALSQDQSENADEKLPESVQDSEMSVPESALPIANERNGPRQPPTVPTRPRPKPPVKPLVKPKPKIKSKPLNRPSISVESNDGSNVSTQSKVEEAERVVCKDDASASTQSKVEKEESMEREPEVGQKERGESNEKVESTEIKSSDGDLDSSMAVESPLAPSIEPEAPVEKDTPEEKSSQNAPEAKPKEHPVDGIVTLNEPPMETPKRPPRKKRMDKSLSQASVSTGSCEDVSPKTKVISPDQNKTASKSKLVSQEQTKVVSPEHNKTDSKQLKKQDNIDEATVEPVDSKLKRFPSRKAPPPPLSLPKQSSAVLDDLPSTKNETQKDSKPKDNSSHIDQQSSISTKSGKSLDTNTEGRGSRDSSPQPGKLNIRNLEANMGLSIGKGLQHQLTSRSRPKPKPKPPLTSPKPKIGKPGEIEGEVGEDNRFSRTPSYSQALKSPDEKAKEESKKDVTDKEAKFNRNPSYSKALDELGSSEEGVDENSSNKRDSVSITGVTSTSSTDQGESVTGVAVPSGKKKTSKPGMVRVLPIDFSLSKLKVQKDLHVDKTSAADKTKQKTKDDDKKTNEPIPPMRKRSSTFDDKDAPDEDATLKRSQTVEALLDVEPSAQGDIDKSPRIGDLKKASSAGDILKAKTGSLKEGRPIFVPPPPPPYSDLNLNEQRVDRNKIMQFPSVEEDATAKGKITSQKSDELDDQVFAEDDNGGKGKTDIGGSTSSSDDDDYEPVMVRRNAGDDEDSDTDHIYEPPPVLPPKSCSRKASDNADTTPVRPPKRKPRRPVPPTPPVPVLSPPTTPLDAGPRFGSPPLPPRSGQAGSPASNSPVLSRSPSDMYDHQHYLEPVRQASDDNSDIYSYADVPDYPFEKKKTPATPVMPKSSPEPKLRAVPEKPNDNTDQDDRKSSASFTSVRTSGGSHIYESVGSRSGSVSRPNPSSAEAGQRRSGKSVFYFGVDDAGEAPAVPEHRRGPDDEAIPPPPIRDSSLVAGRDSQRDTFIEAGSVDDPAMDTPIPLPPQAPPRLKKRQTRTPSSLPLETSKRKSTDSDSSDSSDYIYPDDPDFVTPENSMYKKEEESEGRTEGEDQQNNNVDESFYHEAEDQENNNLEESIYHEADELPEGIDESIYNEADDTAVDCPSGSDATTTPSTPPPVPPRDHHRSEPVPHAIRQALNLQRQASALSDTNVILEKRLKMPVPKTVSFESQLADSALSLTPGDMTPTTPTTPGDKPPRGKKQRSHSNPALPQLSVRRPRTDSLQEDSASTSSDRPSSWASSGDGYEDPTDLRRFKQKDGDDSVSLTSDLHPGSMVFSHHGSGSSLNSEPSDLSDHEHEEWHKEKAEKRKKKVYNIAREMMTSEETFVDILKLLNIEFRFAMSKATESHEHTIVPPSVMNQILQYLPQLQNFNEELLKDLKERIKDWENNPRVADIFVRKGPFLKMYTFYIREFENSMTALDEARKKYPEFDGAVKEFEASPRCKHLLLKHYMLKPIQRIPQYRLLLQEYQKYLSSEHIDFKDTQAALVIVSEVAEHANQSMKYGDNFKKLWEIQSSLIGQFEVIKPGREYIREGMLQKLSRKVMQPRMFFLFSDVLLYTTPVSGGYKLNNHIPLTGMRVILPTKEDFQNELSILSTQRSFTISAHTAQERDEWLSTLQAAIKDNAKRRSSFDVRKLHKMPSILVEVEKDLTLGTRAPVWVPDARVSMCMLCTAEFSVTFRRHHCRACGKVVCGYCSDYRAPLRYLKYKAARVCAECYRKLSKEFDEEGLPELPVTDEVDKDSPFSRANIKARFRGITWGSYRKASKAKRPAVLQEVTANEEAAEMSGYLKVWKSRKWKKLWFVLKGKALYTFKASEDTAAIESRVLLGYEVQTFNSWFEGVEPSLVFEIRHVGTAAMVLRTESPASRDKWLQAVREATMP